MSSFDEGSAFGRPGRRTVLGALLGVEISREIAGLFIASMLAMIGALSLFLREVYLAVITGNHNRR